MSERILRKPLPDEMVSIVELWLQGPQHLRDALQRSRAMEEPGIYIVPSEEEILGVWAYNQRGRGRFSGRLS